MIYIGYYLAMSLSAEPADTGKVIHCTNFILFVILNFSWESAVKEL